MKLINTKECDGCWKFTFDVKQTVVGAGRLLFCPDCLKLHKNEIRRQKYREGKYIKIR